MKITGIEVIPFQAFADRFSNGDPYHRQRVLQTLTKVVTDEGVEGCYFGGHFHGDQDGLLATEQVLNTQLIGPLLVGQDPLGREKIWQWLLAAKIPENVMSVIDLALWDLAGRIVGLPMHKLLGGARDKVRAYASMFNNLGMPEDYAAYAVECKRPRLRRLQDPLALLLGPRHEAGRTAPAVPRRLGHQDLPRGREAVGDDMVLMYDPWGTLAESGADVCFANPGPRRCISWQRSMTSTKCGRF